MSALSFTRKTAPPLFAALFVLCASAVALCQQAEKVTLCRLQEDPAAYNHKLIELTGFVSHGFEDFALFDPSCPARSESSQTSVWLEYGGKASSNTIYCCGVTPSRTRPKQLVVEKIPVKLLDDEVFRRFDEMIQGPRGSTVHATLVGRFFAGELVKWPAGSLWGGYGHMGCCSLLAIERVVSVDPQDREDLDYESSADQPNLQRAGCGYKFLTRDLSFEDLREEQRQAEEGARAWAFEDPRRVASEALARLTNLDAKSLARLTETRRAQGRVVFRIIQGEKQPSYMVVVNRPYVLSFYAKEKRVPWVIYAAYESSCGGANSVTLIR